MAGRVRYSREQLNQYFDRICLPSASRRFDVSNLSDDEQLSYLFLLQKHQLVKVPWENLEQHYSWHHVVHLHPQHLYRKIVRLNSASTVNTNRGGYCMEANFFFHTVLLSLNFRAYMAGSRIYNPATRSYGGWSHVINLVTVGGTKFLIDGGFGGNGPCRPIPLVHNQMASHIAPASMRLVYEGIDQALDPSQKVWKYEHRFNDNAPWIPMYCFVELEFFPADIEGMNLHPASSRHTFFTHKVVAVRFTTDKEIDEPGAGPGVADEKALEGEIDGCLTINQDYISWRRHGKKVLQIDFKTEDHRIDALEKYFGITFSDEDRAGIVGTAAEIGAAVIL